MRRASRVGLGARTRTHVAALDERHVRHPLPRIRPCVFFQHRPVTTGGVGAALTADSSGNDRFNTGTGRIRS